MLDPTKIDPAAMFGKTIYQDAGGARWKLVGDRIDVTGIVPKSDLVSHLKRHGMNGATGEFYAKKDPRSFGGSSTNADLTARYFIARDAADFVIVGTIVRKNEAITEYIVNLCDIALVCESAEEVEAVEVAKARHYAEATAPDPAPDPACVSRFQLPILDVEARRLAILDVLCSPAASTPPGMEP